MKRVLVISDSHGGIKEMEKVLKKEKYDISIHLGDSGATEEWLTKNFDYYLSGNNDIFQLDKKQKEKVIEVENFLIAITHGDDYEASFREMIKFNERVSRYKLIKLCRDIRVNAILYGHSHIKDDTKLKDYRIINPGSFLYPRDDRQGTYLILEIDNNSIKNIEFKNAN